MPCTKELLLSLIEDIELIARELIENSVAPKQNRMAAHEHKAVTELLVTKDKELKETLKLAAEQGEVEKEIEMVKRELHQFKLCWLIRIQFWLMFFLLLYCRCELRCLFKTSTSKRCRGS